MHTRPAMAKLALKSMNDHGKRTGRGGAPKGNTSNYRAKPYDRQRPTNDNSKRDSHGFGPPTECIMTGCSSVHYLGQCQEFRRLSFADKLAVVKEHKLCRCCLMIGHMSATCKKRGCSNCPDAKYKHHFHLCSKNIKSEQFKVEKSDVTPSNQ